MVREGNEGVVNLGNDSLKKKRFKLFKNEWVKILMVSFVSLFIAIAGILNNIEREKQRVYSDMKLKIKGEVEKELYSELIDKFESSVRSDLKKEYRDFVKIELKDTLREDTLRSLKHEIDTQGADLTYEVFESIEYKHNGENIHHCEVVVNNLDKVFEEELEGLYKQIFGSTQDKKGILLVFSKEPDQVEYRPDFRLENGINDQILIIQDGKRNDFADNMIY